MNHEALAAQVVRELRGERSQVQLSRRLGFASNAVYAWEAGRKFPRATTFFLLLERVGHPLDALLRRFLPQPPAALLQANLRERDGVAALLGHLAADRTAVELGEALGTGRQVVGRWLRGESEPRLPQLLAWIEVTTDRLPDFVATFADPAALPSLRLRWSRLTRSRELLIEAPWVQTLLLATELQDYQHLAEHDGDWVSARMGVSRERVDEGLELLASAGLLRWTGTHWTPGGAQTIDTPREREGVRQLKRHWLTVVRERFEADAPGLYSHNLFAVAAEDVAALEALHIEYFHKVRELVARSEPSERVVLLQHNLVPLDEP